MATSLPLLGSSCPTLFLFWKGRGSGQGYRSGLGWSGLGLVWAGVAAHFAIIPGLPWSGQRCPSSGKGEVVAKKIHPLLGSSITLFWKSRGGDNGHHPWSALEWTEGPPPPPVPRQGDHGMVTTSPFPEEKGDSKRRGRWGGSFPEEGCVAMVTTFLSRRRR